MNFQDILSNSNTTPGYGSDIFIIEKKDIPTFPAITANSNLISAAFVPEAGKGFYKIPISTISGKAPFDQEPQGDDDNPTRNDTFEVFHPGVDPVTSYFLDQINGQRVYILVPMKGQCNEAGDPIYQVLGNACQGVSIRTRWKDDGTIKGYYISANGYATTLPLQYDQAIAV